MNDQQRIMIVDDDLEMLNLLNRTLDLEGFHTIIVSNSNVALTLLEGINQDLIVLDIMMPGLDVFQTIDLIREHSDIPIIMLITKGEVEPLQKSLFIGADDYIEKPFSTRALIGRIRAKLRRTRQITPQPLKKD